MNSRMTTHHIIPRSRLKNKHLKDNTVQVSEHEHEKYHQLFVNMTPVEIIDYLVKTFWGGKTEYLEEYLRNSSGGSD